jgi:RNA polymerase sigma factor (sigma-70 family)
MIWDRHRDRVLRHLQLSGNTHADAEDLTAMVFLELWRRRNVVRFVDGSLLPWLIVTAQNVHRNAQRAQRRYRAFLASLPEPEHTPDHAERFAEFDDAQLIRLRGMLAGARPADARLLAMTSLEGFTVREAAEALGLSESAARMRLSRLRQRLSTALTPTTEGEPS